jgi:hypothetical protein
LALLEEWEFAGVRVAVTDARLARGEEYLDLDQIQDGVQRGVGTDTLLAHVLPRKAVHEDTWRRILRQLSATLL